MPDGFHEGQLEFDEGPPGSDLGHAIVRQSGAGQGCRRQEMSGLRLLDHGV
jgi:hypothetical protein